MVNRDAMTVPNDLMVAPTASLKKRAKRVSQAEMVVANARARRLMAGNIADLPSTRLERSAADGKPTLNAVFAAKGGGKPDILDLSYLLDFPGLCDVFAKGVLALGKSQKPRTRLGVSHLLRRYWFSYLRELRLIEITSVHVDDQVMTGFKEWLHHQRNGGDPLHPNTIRRALGCLRNVLSSAGELELADKVPPSPRGAERKTQPTAVLRLDELMTVMAAVEKEVLALRDRWALGRHRLKWGRQRLGEGAKLVCNPRGRKESQSEDNLALAMAMLDKRYPGVIPDLEVIWADDPLLGATVKYAIGRTVVTGYFFPSARDLVPLALSIAFATVFNPDTVLTLEWKNIDRNVDRISDGRLAVQFDVTEDVVDEVALNESEQADESPLTKITGKKPRALRSLVRLLDPEANGTDQVSLNLVLDLLIEMTARIRPHVIGDGEYADRVFLFVQKVMAKRPKGFGVGKASPSHDQPWAYGLKSFITDNNLPDFTLKTIRATLIDYVQLFNRGDLEAARAVGNHRSRVTTWTHYTSDLVKRLLQESTGETLLVRERWLTTTGTIDPRPFREWTNKGCSTPGFYCLDPFDSPRPNQIRGKLCTAYGECPDCPLCAANPTNPHNVALYEALLRAIFRSVTTMTASMWQQRWAPPAAALDALLSRVLPKTMDRSRQIVIELPNVG